MTSRLLLVVLLVGCSGAEAAVGSVGTGGAGGSEPLPADGGLPDVLALDGGDEPTGAGGSDAAIEDSGPPDAGDPDAELDSSTDAPTDSGELPDAGEPLDACELRDPVEACAELDCGSVPDGCGSELVCGRCGGVESCVEGTCTTGTGPTGCRRRVDVFVCELDLPRAEPEWSDYPETWVDCEEAPGDCVDARFVLSTIGVELAEGSWCCR